MTAKAAATAGFDSARARAAAIILTLLVLAAALPLVAGPVSAFTLSLFEGQDAWIAPAFAFACLLHARAEPPLITRAGRGERALWLGIALAIVLCWTGHYLVFDGFDTFRDERMVSHDAAIFRSGALVWPIAEEWRPLADGLNRKFMLPIGAAEYWVSAYLPVNAAFHAAVGLLVDEDLTAPLFVGAGLYFLWRIALRLWPESPGTRITVVALYLGSSQIIVTGMTKFAMSGHLALNLAWLWLFLRDRRGSHAAAMLVGFLATGLHQPLFHPLFVLPFFGLLLAQKRWHLLGAYLAAYACIAAFWLSWPVWMASFGTGPVAPIAGTEVDFAARLRATVKGVGLEGSWLMIANLVRFVSWQHLLLMPLALFGTCAAWRAEPLVRAVAIGFVLPILVMWVLLPWQGTGWGYRYLHPVLGNAILLGGCGWAMLERRGLGLDRPMIWTTAASLLVLLPLHGAMARQLIGPKAVLDRSLAALETDVAILDPQIYDDFVHNRPDLSNRPIRLLGGEVPVDRLAGLCRGRSLTFVDPPAPMRTSQHQLALRRAATDAGCAWTAVGVGPDGRLSRP